MTRWLKAGGVLAASVVVSVGVAAGPALVAPTALAAVTSPAPSAPSWTAAALAVPPGTMPGSSVPLALSCSSAKDCAGGGQFRVQDQPNAGLLAELVDWDGTRWTAQKAPLPADASSGAAPQNAKVDALSCPARGVCFAAGVYRSSTAAASGMLLTLSGGTWSAITAPLPADASPRPLASVSGISCPTATSCTAVGQYETTASSSSGALILTLSGGTWSATEAPGVTGEDISLRAVSCPTLTRCFAAGLQHNAATGAEEPFLDTWSPRRGWTVVDVSLPADAAASPAAVLDAVSCATVSRCIAAGAYTDAAGTHQGVLLSLSGRKWVARTAPVPADAASDPIATLLTASCPTATRCTVGGSYQNTSSAPAGLILTMTGPTLTAIAAPAGALSLRGVSCPSRARCLALSEAITQPLVLTGP